MDEFIYILLAVAWIAYSIYSAKQKKKQRMLETEKKASPARNETTESPQKPARSILEEIFEPDFSQDFEEEFEYETEWLETTSHDQLHTEEIAQSTTHQSLQDYLKKMPDSDNRIKETSHEFEPTETASAQSGKLDLRTAVIYSVILERPYK